MAATGLPTVAAILVAGGSGQRLGAHVPEAFVTVPRRPPHGPRAGGLDRWELAAVQTPQGFRRAVLVEAHARAGGEVATDDAGLVEALGRRVVGVPGADESFKITTPGDLARAEGAAYADQ